MRFEGSWWRSAIVVAASVMILACADELPSSSAPANGPDFSFEQMGVTQLVFFPSSTRPCNVMGLRTRCLMRVWILGLFPMERLARMLRSTPVSVSRMNSAEPDNGVLTVNADQSALEIHVPESIAPRGFVAKQATRLDGCNDDRNVGPEKPA